MIAPLWNWLSDVQDDPGQTLAHESRNQWMEHQVPESMPADVDCVHDPATGVTWVREGPVEHEIQVVTGLHDVGDETPDSFRGILPPDHREQLLADPQYQQWFDDLNGGKPQEYPEPGFQASYLNGHLTDRGTFDAASPQHDLWQHVALDVAPHEQIGGDYHRVDMSNGADFSHVDSASWEANSGSCYAGDYDGLTGSTDDAD